MEGGEVLIRTSSCCTSCLQSISISTSINQVDNLPQKQEVLTSSTSSTVVSFLGAGWLKRFSSRAAAWSAVAF